MKDEARVNAIVEALLPAWREKRTMAPLSGALAPVNMEEAFDVQEELARRLGRETAGWKLGMSSPAAMKTFKIDRPMPGRLFRDAMKSGPASFARNDFNVPMLEAEFAFRMARDLAPRFATYGRDEVLDAVETGLLGIEVADSRYDAKPPIDPRVNTADNGATGAYVTGPAIKDWRRIDYVGHEVKLLIDGREIGQLKGEMRPNCLDVLVWTANELSRRGVGLKAGDVISTGAAAAPYRMERGGGQAVADFGALGRVECAIA
jgi:2-keto-4-pentenoate hydratase